MLTHSSLTAATDTSRLHEVGYPAPRRKQQGWQPTPTGDVAADMAMVVQWRKGAGGKGQARDLSVWRLGSIWAVQPMRGTCKGFTDVWEPRLADVIRGGHCKI